VSLVQWRWAVELKLLKPVGRQNAVHMMVPFQGSRRGKRSARNSRDGSEGHGLNREKGVKYTENKV
jgi:hypothetical protein